MDEDAADQGPQGVLVVGRHHVPRGPWRGRGGEGLLTGCPVLVPEFALGEISRRELPALGGVVEAFQEPLPLLVSGDVQEQLHDPGVAAMQVAFEGVDVLVALLPHAFLGSSPEAAEPSPRCSGCIRTTKTSS